MTYFEKTLAKVSPRLKAAEACLRVEKSIGPHRVPMALIGFIAVIIGFKYPALVIFALAIVNYAISIFLLWYAGRCIDSASDTWMQEFRKVAWTTACGEKINLLEVSECGRGAVIKFEDGETMNYPTSILLPVENETYLGLLPPAGGDPLTDAIEAMLKTKWQTPGGDVGIIREFNFFALGDRRRTNVTLKLQSGKQDTFFQTQLTELTTDN
jgi:hypothetical protein